MAAAAIQQCLTCAVQVTVQHLSRTAGMCDSGWINGDAAFGGTFLALRQMPKNFDFEHILS